MGERGRCGEGEERERKGEEEENIRGD